MKILVQAQKIKKEYSGQTIFSGLSFTVSLKQKIGLIGINGSGKSTLFRIIAGLEEASDGQLIIHQDTHLAYLTQMEDWQDEETALDYLIRKAGCPDWEAKKLASRFQLDANKLSMRAESLSGGWRMRLRLCGVLLKQPNLLLLDEPSNYLDLNTLILLENYLKSYRQSFIIISHDREFLKRTCEETMEISKNSCYHYPGNIENYLAFKERKSASVIKTNKSLKRQAEHWQEFVDHFRFKDSKARQAQSVMKKINKLEKKRIGIDHQASINHIKINKIIKKKNFALRINNLSAGYNKKAILSNIDFDCKSGEKLAILGLNGQGKTTLLKTLMGKIETVSGNFRFDISSKIAYHGPEEMDEMDGQEQAGKFLRRLAAPEIKTEKVLKMAGDFLFKEEELKKSISVLSGGEKSRLLLAGILLSKPDILLLDEPTCHLDFSTTEALGQALREWNGTVLFSSHDRTFSKLVSNGIVEIKDGQAKRYHLEYEDYVSDLEKQLQENSSEENKEEISENKKYKYQLIKERKKEFRTVERQISEMNQRKKELLEYFLEHYEDTKPEMTKEFQELCRCLDDKEDLWLKISEELSNP